MAGFGGLAFVGQGYDQAVDEYWKRRNDEMALQSLQALGRGIGNGGIPGSMPVSPTSLNGLPPGPGIVPPSPSPSPSVVPGTLTGSAMPLPAPPPSATNPRAAELYQKLFTAFQQNPPNQLPPDAAQYGITQNTPDQLARFGVNIAGRESGFNPRSTNLTDPGGSFGEFQYSHPQAYGNAYNVDNSVRAFVRDVDASAVDRRGFGGGVLGQRFSTVQHPLSAQSSPASVRPPGAAPPVAPGGPMQSAAQLIERIRQANPNLPPEALAGAVLKAVPLLTMISQAEQRQIQQNLQQLQFQMMEEDRRARLDLEQQSLGLREKEFGLKAEQQGKENIQSAATALENLETSSSRIPVKIREQAMEIARSHGWKGDTAFTAYQRWNDPNSTVGKGLQSQQTVQGHLEVLENLALNQKNWNAPVANEVRNWIRANVLGAPEPTNAAEAARIVGSEVVKATLGGQPGTGGERAANAMRTGAMSPDQIMGYINTTVRPLLAERRDSMKHQYENETGKKDFDEKLPPVKFTVTPSTGGTYKDIPFTIKPRSSLESGGQNQQMAQIGARQAPDGNWYVTDPDRPGKYMQVMMANA